MLIRSFYMPALTKVCLNLQESVGANSRVHVLALVIGWLQPACERKFKTRWFIGWSSPSLSARLLAQLELLLHCYPSVELRQISTVWEGTRKKKSEEHLGVFGKFGIRLLVDKGCWHRWDSEVNFLFIDLFILFNCSGEKVENGVGFDIGLFKCNLEWKEDILVASDMNSEDNKRTRQPLGWFHFSHKSCKDEIQHFAVH